MTCPSCGRQFKSDIKHCTHCGIAITLKSVEISQVVQNLGWIARRSLAGFFAAGVGSVLAVAVSRTLHFSQEGPADFSALLGFFPGRDPGATAIAGAFIGAVGGMMERSGYKAFLGGALGAAGGFLVGAAYPIFEKFFLGARYAYSFSMASSWALTASLIGLTSGLLEGTRKKILAGLLGGLVGGALGGGVGSQIYGAILMEAAALPSLSWSLGRLIEGVGGGVVGLHVWFFIGAMEKLYIFKRRKLSAGEKKTCDSCHAENEINAWYCGSCGKALQMAASQGQISITPYRGLERVSNAFMFLAWLTSTAGVVSTGILFAAFIGQNILFAVFGALLLALALYIISMILRSISEAIRAAMKMAETNK